MDLDSPFYVAVRGIKSPTSSGFDLSELENAYALAANKNDDDRALFETAKWIGNEASSLRESVSLADLEKLGRDFVNLLTAAVANIEFQAVNDLGNDAIKDALDKGALAFDHLSGLTLRGAMEGQKVTGAAHTEVVVDAAESWLFDAAKLGAASERPPSDLSPVMLRAARRYSIQHNQRLMEPSALRRLAST